MNYDTICISGGGLKGLILLGALQSSIDMSILNLKNVNTFVGTSVGSMINYLLAIGYTPLELIDNILKSKILEKLNNFNIFSLLDFQGMISFTPIQEYLEKLTLEKIGKFYTMDSFYKQFNKKLIFTTYNMTKGCIEYISYENYPDLPCIVGIRMSCNVPLLFDKYFYDNCYYIDGGMVENFSITKAEEESKESVLGFTVLKELFLKKNHNIYEYLLTVISIPIIELVKNKMVNKTEKSMVIDIIDDKRFLFDFKINDFDIIDLYKKGYGDFRTIYTNKRKQLEIEKENTKQKEVVIRIEEEDKIVKVDKNTDTLNIQSLEDIEKNNLI